MNKAIEILTAWTNVVTGDEAVRALAEERMNICSTCPFKAKEIGIEVCGKCSCPLLGKTHSPVNSCPMKKWLK